MRHYLLLILLILSLNTYSQTSAGDPVPQWLQDYRALVNKMGAAMDEKQAMDLLKQAISIVDTTSVEGMSYYLADNVALMNLYTTLGNYDESERILYTIAQFFVGEREAYESYRAFLSSCGLLYLNLRNYDKALFFLEKAKTYFEYYLDLGVKYAGCLNNIAQIYMWQKNNLKAKMYADVSKDIILNASNDNPDYKIFMLNNLSAIFNAMDYHKDSQEILFHIKDLAESNKRYNYYLPYIYDNLGVLYANQRIFDKSEAYLEKSYNYSKTYGYNDQPLLLLNLCMVNYELGDNKKAYKYTKELVDFIKDDAIIKFSFLDSDAREKYWSRNNDFLVSANTYMLATQNDSSEINIYNNILFSKGLLLRTSNHVRNQVMMSNDKDLISAYNEMSAMQAKLAQNNVPSDSIRIYKLAIAYIEKQIMANVSDYSDVIHSRNRNWKEIQEKLSNNEIAIEFVPLYNVNDTLNGDIDRYAAALIRKSYAHPKIIQLCTHGHLDSLLNNRTGLNAMKFVNRLYTGNVAQELYNSIWKPIESELSGVKTIYYSPTGILNSISFNAIPIDKKVLADKYNLMLLSSTGDIQNIKKKGKDNYKDAIIYGGITYDASEDKLLASARGYSESSNRSVFVGDSTTRGSWNFLPGTKAEAESITGILNNIGVETSLLEDVNANEESFKNLDHNSKAIIHLATHGFYLNKAKDIVNNKFVIRNSSVDSDGAFNPMRLTGLLFAGANRAWNNNNVITGIEDGILTADEISQIDLANTEIVILSACTTGLGNFASPEGVFGLQRAFKLAGVKSIVMSLWEVPDEATSNLMQFFYQNIAKGMEKHKAFKEAQKRLRRQEENPFSWAGFVMLD